jgi:polysaccharide pyruvyl transferase WcaK-like protein
MSKTKKDILLLGMYGSGSAGDDAILQSILEAFPEYAITITQGSYFDTGKLFGVNSIFCRMYEGMSLRVFFSVLLSSFKLFVRLLRSDALMFGGGSLVHDLSAYNLPFFFFWHAIALIFKKPVIYFGIGIGPVRTKSGRRLCRYFLSRATLLFVRDSRGKAICDSLGVDNAILSHDAVFLRAGKAAADETLLSNLQLREGRYVAVSGCGWFHTDNYWAGKTSFAEEVNNYAECLLVVRHATGLPLVFAATNKHDFTLGERLKPYFPQDAFLLLPKTLNCNDLQQIFACGAFTFGVRMHSLIFSANAFRPFFCAVYDEKVSQLLLQTGTGRYSLPIERMTPDLLEPLFGAFLQDRADIEKSLMRTIPEFQSDLEGCAAKIKACIEQRHPRVCA